MAHVNRDRFSGFARLYASVRPQPPPKVVEIVLGILHKRRLERVVDLGSGTGLSTGIWTSVSDSVVGIEPTADMRNQARMDYPGIEFLDGTGDQTSLATGSADVVLCSQSFHWMEPTATLVEVNRILKDEGVFVVLDCHWPVTWNWVAEKAYEALVQKAQRVAQGLPRSSDGPEQYPKDQHLQNLRRSGHFTHCGTVLFDSLEDCDAQRFGGMALSQGLVQSLLKQDQSLLDQEIQALKDACSQAPSTTMRVSYTLHYGIKAPPK